LADIILIDDDSVVRVVVRRMLEKKGHRVMEASDGSSGLELIRKNPADLIITDILMPEKEGIETIRELRKEFPEVKIIAISGGGKVGPENYLALAEKIGAQRSLSKPFSWNELMEAVDSLLGDTDS
jgi:DNA-binding response OmpR family regulator